MTAKENGKPRRVGAVGQAFLEAQARKNEKTRDAIRRIAEANHK